MSEFQKWYNDYCRYLPAHLTSGLFYLSPGECKKEFQEAWVAALRWVLSNGRPEPELLAEKIEHELES